MVIHIVGAIASLGAYYAVYRGGKYAVSKVPLKAMAKTVSNKTWPRKVVKTKTVLSVEASAVVRENCVDCAADEIVKAVSGGATFEDAVRSVLSENDAEEVISIVYERVEEPLVVELNLNGGKKK